MEWQQRSGVKSKSMIFSEDGVVTIVGKSLVDLRTQKMTFLDEVDSAAVSWPGRAQEKVMSPEERSRVQITLGGENSRRKSKREEGYEVRGSGNT